MTDTNIHNVYSTWTRDYAIDACHVLEQALAPLGMHVALTGGCLYKEGPRKDLDVILYRHSGMELAPFADLRAALAAIGITAASVHRNVIKCQWTSDGEAWQLDLILRAAVSWPETEACPEGTSEAMQYFRQARLDLRMDELENAVPTDTSKVDVGTVTVNGVQYYECGEGYAHPVGQTCTGQCVLHG